MSTVLHTMAPGEPDDQPNPDDDQARITLVLAELERAWRRNPKKTLTQMVARAAAHTMSFIPDEVSDRRMIYGFRKIGPGPVIPTPPGSDDEAAVLEQARQIVDGAAE